MAHDTRAPRFSPQSSARDPRGFILWMPTARTRLRQGATARRPRDDDFTGDRWHGFRDRNDICHSRHTEANRAMNTEVPFRRSRAAEPRKLRFHAVLDHERDCANRLVQLIAGRDHFRATAIVVRRSGTGPAGRNAGQVPSLPFPAIHTPRQPAIPDEGRSVRI
jgi:hypothetical protein